MAQVINISSVDPTLIENLTFTRPPTSEERASKIKREEWNIIVEHIKEIAVILFAFISVSVIMYICFMLIVDTTASPDDKKWATSIITLMASGTIGYITGKSNATK